MKIRNLLTGVAIICLLSALSGCSIIGGLFGDNRDPDGQVTGAGNVDAFSLRVGDCLISSELEDSFSEVPAVPCNEPHDSEIIYVFDMPGEIYNEEEISDAADDACLAEVANYIGPDWESLTSEGLEVSYFSPGRESWSNGDREVDCIIYTISGENELTSSVKGMG